ncbi:HigA family addiction module antidote protein [Mesorhizobium sp. B2-3-13]|uniref:HigA family addiction module antitoxin n=1 Tax=Mesorhizobium sp. B2-3-13 TaxID=2589951 RepID=UPI00112EAA66|nr:HigA family addiction module antitoxin [Mesorhizobium sp. B2-3-13]TPL79102.1 HigA family addiction module antidote protein [Mesorhizobium sp. B2-3-13]
MNDRTIIPVDHPGTFIVEELEARGWTQVDLAYILGMTPQQLSPILTGKLGISPDMAVALGDAFDVPADFFANLQKQYDLFKAKRPNAAVRARANWLSVFPVREMIKRGWINDSDDPSLLDLQMTRFFNKNRVEDIPFIGSGEVFPHAARKADYSSVTAVQYAWLHRVKKVAESLDCPPYSEDALRQNLPRIRAHMQDKDDLIRIPEILRESGVRFAMVEALPGSKIDGVCVWNEDQPVIGMTTRWDRLDNFCFVLRHECEHVLLGHGKEATFMPVDEFDYDTNEQTGHPDEEIQANNAASEFLVPRKQLESFILRKSPFISERDVLAFAARIEINPAVVVGQIQHRTKNYAWLRKYQKSIRDYLMDWQCIDGWGHQAPTGL